MAPGPVYSAGLERQHVIGAVSICADFRYQAVDALSDRFEDCAQIPALAFRKELGGQVVVQRPFGLANEPMRFTSRLGVYQYDCLERLPVGELAVEARDVIAVDDPHPVAAQVYSHHAARRGMAKMDRDLAKPGRERVPAACLECLPGAERSLTRQGVPGAPALALPVLLKDLGDRLGVQHMDGVGTRFRHLDSQPAVMDGREEAARGRRRHQVPERVAMFPEVVERRHDYGAPMAPTLCNDVELAIDQRRHGLARGIVVQVALGTAAEAAHQVAVGVACVFR